MKAGESISIQSAEMAKKISESVAWHLSMKMQINGASEILFGEEMTVVMKLAWRKLMPENTEKKIYNVIEKGAAWLA
jgi:hypothetical protein